MCSDLAEGSPVDDSDTGVFVRTFCVLLRVRPLLKVHRRSQHLAAKPQTVPRIRVRCGVTKLRSMVQMIEAPTLLYQASEKSLYDPSKN